MSTLKGERVLCLKEANAQAAPNTRQTTHLTRYLRHTTLTGTLALHSAVRTLNPPPARSQHRLNKYVGKTGSSALFQALMPRMSQLSVIKSPALFCWQAARQPSLVECEVYCFNFLSSKTAIRQSEASWRLQLHQKIPQRLGGAICLSRACTDGDAAQNRSSALVVALT